MHLRKSLLIAMSTALFAACADYDEPCKWDGPCLAAPNRTRANPPRRIISQQSKWEPRRPIFGPATGGPGNADYAGFIAPDIEPGGMDGRNERLRVELSIQVMSDEEVKFAHIRCLRLGNGGLADMAALDRQLTVAPHYDYPNFAGPLSDLDPEAEVEIDGVTFEASEIDFWIRGDGLYLQLPGAPNTVVSYGFPTCDGAAQIGATCGRGRILYRFHPASECRP